MEIGGKFALEFVAIQRADTGDWAIPGVSLMLDYLLHLLITLFFPVKTS